MDYFIRKEYGNNYYLHVDDLADLSSRQRTIDKVITDAFEQVVYSLNQPAAARGNQSVFWNIAYFDHPYFEGMFETFVFPDGTPMCWASVNWLQKRFMRWFNQERTRKLLTFPVETLNLLDDGHDYVDQEWADFAAEMWAQQHSFLCTVPTAWTVWQAVADCAMNCRTTPSAIHLVQAAWRPAASA